MSTRVIGRLALLAAVVPVGIAWSTEVSVAAAGLECGNGTMNGHRRKALQADASPKITYRITSYEVAGDGRAKLNGPLNIAGTGRPVGVDPEARKATDVRFDGFREAALRSAAGLFPRGSPPLGPVVCGRTEPQPDPAQQGARPNPPSKPALQDAPASP